MKTATPTRKNLLTMVLYVTMALSPFFMITRSYPAFACTTDRVVAAEPEGKPARSLMAMHPLDILTK
jgi:hypothetical protein